LRYGVSPKCLGNGQQRHRFGVPPGRPAGVFNSGVNPLEIGGNRGHNLPSVTNKDIAGQTFSSVRIE